MKLEFTEKDIEEYQNAPGGPRAPVTHSMFDNLISENKILNERIKVLEDALKFYQYVENYKSTTPVARGDGSYDYDVPVLIDNGEIARAALEVKP